MKRLFMFTSFTIILLLLLGACSGGSKDNESIVGVWKEYRDDPDDDYGLGTWKFNSDGSGLFTVKGHTNTQKVAFTWEESGSTIKINTNGDYQALEISNGLLIEKSSFGTIVYKK